LLSFRKCFLNKKIFVLKKFYFRFGSTFTFVCKLKSFRFLNKNNFTFVSKTVSFRKYFLNKNIFVLKKIYFRFGNTRLLFRKRFVKQMEKNRISFVVVAHGCHPPLRANVSTCESLICRFSNVDVWLACDRIARTCRIV